MKLNCICCFLEYNEMFKIAFNAIDHFQLVFSAKRSSFKLCFIMWCFSKFKNAIMVFQASLFHGAPYLFLWRLKQCSVLFQVKRDRGGVGTTPSSLSQLYSAPWPLSGQYMPVSVSPPTQSTAYICISIHLNAK